MGLTILLTIIMMALLWLMIWSATVTLPYKGLIKNFPKDVQERLEPRLNDLPMSAKRMAGWAALLLILAMMIGVFIWGGLDGIYREYGFGRLFVRFLIIGFGVKAFTLSILETAMRVSRNEMPAATISSLLQECYTLLEFPCTPLPDVEETLQWLKDCTGYRLVVFTKGELLDQEHKLQRSGLQGFFSHTEITSDKGQEEFRQLCAKLHVEPREMLMVGNSLKSDIAPALAIGCRAVYVPFHVTWQLEHADDFSHPRMTQIEHFAQLKDFLTK